MRSERAVTQASAAGAQPFGGPRQVSWLEKGYKPPTPWEAACRSPFGLVEEAFSLRNLQQSIAYTVKSAAHRKALPEPPEEWKARVSYDRPAKTHIPGFSTPPPFMSPAKSTASAPPAPGPCTPPLWMRLPQRSVTESSVWSSSYPPRPGLRSTQNRGWRW